MRREPMPIRSREPRPIPVEGVKKRRLVVAVVLIAVAVSLLVATSGMTGTEEKQLQTSAEATRSGSPEQVLKISVEEVSRGHADAHAQGPPADS